MTVKQVIVGTLAGTTIIGLMLHKTMTAKVVSHHPKKVLSTKIALHKTHTHKKHKNSSGSEISLSRLY